MSKIVLIRDAGTGLLRKRVQDGRVITGTSDECCCGTQPECFCPDGSGIPTCCCAPPVGDGSCIGQPECECDPNPSAACCDGNRECGYEPVIPNSAALTFSYNAARQVTGRYTHNIQLNGVVPSTSINCNFVRFESVSAGTSVCQRSNGNLISFSWTVSATMGGGGAAISFGISGSSGGTSSEASECLNGCYNFSIALLFNGSFSWNVSTRFGQTICTSSNPGQCAVQSSRCGESLQAQCQTTFSGPHSVTASMTPRQVRCSQSLRDTSSDGVANAASRIARGFDDAILMDAPRVKGGCSSCGGGGNDGLLI